VELVPGGDEGVGSGAGEDVWVGAGVGSGLGDGDGSAEGSGDGEGSGVGDGVGGGFFFSGPAAIAPDDMALRMNAIAKSATHLTGRAPLLRRPLDPPAT
jgi:hypothetical protein